MKATFPGRIAFLLLVLPLLARAWQTGVPPALPCQRAGQMFGGDLLERTLTLKSDSGDYSAVRYDDSTSFTDGKAILSPQQLNIDDRVCVEAFFNDNPKVASRIRVTLRSDIDARHKWELLRWQNESVFGTVKSLDRANSRIRLSLSESSEVLVDATGSAFWKLPAEAIEAADGTPGNWETLKPGDALYVRGDWVPGARTIRARLIISGGFRTVVGAIESMDPLTEMIRLRDFRSGHSHDVHFDFMPIYLAGKAPAPDAGERRLYSGSVGDLRAGDPVLILGRDDKQTGNIHAFLLITGFSPGEVMQPGTGQSPDWVFQAVGIGGERASNR